jgi:hypothetical protein
MANPVKTIKFARGTQKIGSTWRRASKLNSIRIDSQTDDDSSCPDPSGDCGHRHSKVVPGYGKKEFPFPSTDELVRAAIAYFNALAREYEKRGQRLVIGGDGASATDGMREDFLDYVHRSVNKLARTPFNRGMRRRMIDRAWEHAKRSSNEEMQAISLPKSVSSRLIPTITGEFDESSGNVLRVMAGTLAEILEDGRFLAVIARQFDPLKGSVNWALGRNAGGKFNTEPKFHPVATSLKMHLDKIEDIYTEALPRVLQFLAAQYSKASEQELLDAAVSVLNEQLAEILYVLSIWTDSFAQRRDGMYDELEHYQFLLEHCLSMVLSRGAKTHVFHLDDVFMPRFSDQDPATIPAGRGPVGAHAVEVPHYFRPVLIQEGPIFAHEFRHDVYEDVEGLKDSSIEAVISALKAADKAGKFKFTNTHLQLGKQKVKTIDLLVQIYAQTLSETDADIAGGILLTGESYVYCMLSTFGAFNIRGVSPFGANRMLRHSSVFAVTEEGELGFEPHMPDYIRAIICAAALENIGFHAEAKECKRLARQAAGRPVPEFIVWRNYDPDSKFKFEIKVPVADLEQAAPVVVDAIINAPLPALGGLRNCDLVNWNRHRQAKVDALVHNLLNGKTDIPWEMGDFTPTYGVAAAAKAGWALVKDGSVAPKLALLEVERSSRVMMHAIRAHIEAKRAQQPAPDSPAAKTDGGATVPVNPTAGEVTVPAAKEEVTAPPGATAPAAEVVEKTGS